MAALQKLGDKEINSLDADKIRIGRSPENEIVIDDNHVSGFHAVISKYVSPDKENMSEYILEDLKSTNHTYVNNVEISAKVLRNGDIIRIGRTRLKFSSKNIIPSKPDFQETQKLNPNQLSDYLFTK